MRSIVALLFSSIFAADASTCQNIVQLAQATPDLSTLVTALSAGELTETLSGTGPFTVFAPTNEAFDKIETVALNDLLANKEQLIKVLEYHVLAANFSMQELMALKAAETVEGEQVNVSDTSSIQVNGEASVVQADVVACNGYVHIIDSLLMPPSLPPLPNKKNIVEIAEGNDDLSTLVTALTAGGLTETLSGTGPFTVFAPTNEAFEKIETKALSDLLANKDQLAKVLEYHVLAANFSMRELMALKAADTVEGEQVNVSDTSSIQVNGEASVVQADVLASNGYVHIIDSLLMPPSLPPLPIKVDIVKVAERNDDLSTLVAALTAGKLVKTLEGEGPFTVFAPTNEAFARIPKETLNQVLANVTLLDQLLEYHVLSGSFAAQDLLAAKAKTTLENKDVAIRTIGGKVLVNNAEVVAADVEASNGIVHVVDNVLVPPDFPVAPYSADIVELAESQPDLSTLVAALVAGKLTDTLSGSGPFTVFAPTNEAFAKIPAADLQKLLADTKALDKVLEYHVLAGTFKMRELMAARSIATLEGDTVTVTETGNVINVNEANVFKFDVAATNGIVHLIDTVLSVPTETLV